MPSTDYTTDTLTIIKMVYNRLTFLDQNDAALQTRIKEFVFELMHELETCLRVSYVDHNNTQAVAGETAPPWPDPLPAPDKVGHEEFYTVQMQALIADLVVLSILGNIAAFNANQGGTGAGTDGVFMSKAKADVVEVEWKQLDAAVSGGLSSLRLNTTDLMKYYREMALRKAAKFGCVIEICDPCATAGVLAVVPSPMPFLVVTECGCGC